MSENHFARSYDRGRRRNFAAHRGAELLRTRSARAVTSARCWKSARLSTSSALPTFVCTHGRSRLAL